MRNFTRQIANRVLRHFEARSNHLSLLGKLETTAEEWFRIELLNVFSLTPGVKVTSTNRRARKGRDRPDFALQVSGRELLVELKVLPKDRHYRYGWQRFLAGSNNKSDFRNLASGARHGVIYVYWPERADWAKCRANLQRDYPVDCIHTDSIALAGGEVFFSYWSVRQKKGRPTFSLV